MANTIDHSQLAGESWQDMVFAVLTGQVSANPTLDLCAPIGLTYAYGAAAGTAPTAFTTQAQFASGSNALRGVVYFNTGSATPAGGVILTVTLPLVVPIANANALPFIFANPRGISAATSQASAAWTYAIYPTMSGANCTGWTLQTTSTITASQGTATAAAYGVEYLWMA